MVKNKVRLVLFDFDGTLTRSDTLLEFIKYFRGRIYFFIGLIILSPLLILFKMRFIKNSIAKEMLMRYYWGGTAVEEFQNRCLAFAQNEIPKLIRTEALKKLRFHQSVGDDIYVVSASPENWVRFYCNSIGVSCIASRLDIKDGKVTGKIDGKNCYGPEKVNRIKTELNVEDYSSIVAYGDSKGDVEMLAMAHHSYYRNFND